MIKKILVAYDDGNHAAKALDTAIEIAKVMSAEIHLGSAYSIPTNDWERYANMSGLSMDSSTIDNFHENNRKYLEKIQAEAGEKVKQANIQVHSTIMQGKPGPVLVELAENLKVDLIVIGSHNRSNVGSIFLGSVSNYVLHNATCPVIVIKE